MDSPFSADNEEQEIAVSNISFVVFPKSNSFSKHNCLDLLL